MESRKALRSRRSVQTPLESAPELHSEESESEDDSSLGSSWRHAAHAVTALTRLKSLTKVTDHLKTSMYGECLKAGKTICSKETEDCNQLHITSAPNVMGDDIVVEFKSQNDLASGTIHIVVEAISNVSHSLIYILSHLNLYLAL